MSRRECYSARGLIFIRTETIDFRDRHQTSHSPFEAFITNAVRKNAPYSFVLPVTDRRGVFLDPLVEVATTKVGPARGYFGGLYRVWEIVAVARALRRQLNINNVVVRVPEHTNLLLLPLLEIFGFRIIVWLVHDRQLVAAADSRTRNSPLSMMARWLGATTGLVEAKYLTQCAVVANGSAVAKRYCANNPKCRVIYSSLLTTGDLEIVQNTKLEDRRETNEIRLIFAGRLAIEKGLDRLFAFYHALQQIARHQDITVKLTLVGKIDLAMKNFFTDNANARLAYDDITLLSPVPRGPLLWQLFLKHDFLCLLSTAEGTPRVVPDALACNLIPILSTEANSDCISPFKGLILDEPDVASLAANTLALFKNRPAFFEARRQSAALAHRYSLDRVFDAFDATTTTPK